MKKVSLFRNRRFILNAGCLAVIFSVVFSAFTYMDFPETNVRLDVPKTRVGSGFDARFILRSFYENSVYIIQTAGVPQEGAVFFSYFFINDKPIGRIHSGKKTCQLEFSSSLLRMGENTFRIEGGPERDFTLIRLQDVYGHSRRLLPYVVVSKHSNVGSRLLVHFPEDLFFSLLFFIFCMVCFSAIAAVNGRFNPVPKFKALLNRFLVIALFPASIVFIPFISRYLILIGVRTLFFLMLFCCFFLLDKKNVGAWIFRNTVAFCRKIPASIQITGGRISTFHGQWKYRKLLLPFLLILSSSSLYVNTLLPGLGYTGDTSKFQFIGKVMGVPHATGYPLYIILNKLFIQIPIRSVSYRANLMSALFAVLTVLLLYASIRMFVKNEWIGFCVSLLFAFSRTFWSQALVAEVYSLNSFCVILAFYLLIKWSLSKKKSHFYLFLFSYALSFGNHMTMITLFPAFLVFVLLVDPRTVLHPKSILIAIGSVMIGAGQYFLLYVRTIQKAVYVELPIWNRHQFVDLVTGKQFHRNMFDASFHEFYAHRIPMFFKQLNSEITPFLLFLGAIGILVCFGRSRKIFWLLFLGFLGESFFLLNYDIPDISIYAIPVVLIFSMFVAIGWQFASDALRRPFLRFAVGAIAVMIIVWIASGNFSRVDLSRETEADDKFTTFVDNIEDDAVIATDNYLDKMYMLNRIYLHTPKKNLYHLELERSDAFQPQITWGLFYIFRGDNVLRLKQDRRLYLVSEETNQAFRSQGLQTIPVIFTSRNRKEFLFYRVRMDVHLFH